MEKIKKYILNVLEDNKAQDITLVDVTNKSSVTDLMFIASGRSTRHVKAIADNLVTKLKKNKIKPLGVEGYNRSEWILIDYGDLLVKSEIAFPSTLTKKQRDGIIKLDLN